MSRIHDVIKKNPGLKKWLHALLVAEREARPRRWVRWFVNPFYHKKGKGVIIRRRTRLDVFPFNRFEVGDKSVIEDFSIINNGVGDVLIGQHSLIGISNVIIGPVTIGNHVIFAQHIVASGLNHGYEDITVPVRDQKVRTAPIHIGDACWIGANVVLTAGVSVGSHSVIGAGSVVTKDIPAYAVAAGNPARVIRQYDHGKKEWLRF